MRRSTAGSSSPRSNRLDVWPQHIGVSPQVCCLKGNVRHTAARLSSRAAVQPAGVWAIPWRIGGDKGADKGTRVISCSTQRLPSLSLNDA